MNCEQYPKEEKKRVEARHRPDPLTGWDKNTEGVGVNLGEKRALRELE